MVTGGRLAESMIFELAAMSAPQNKLYRNVELKKIFISSLPVNATEESVSGLFAEFGRVRSVHVVRDVFSGRCKGFATIEMEGHEARAAIAGLDGKRVGENTLRVKFEVPRHKRGRR